MDFSYARLGLINVQKKLSKKQHITEARLEKKRKEKGKEKEVVPEVEGGETGETGGKTEKRIGGGCGWAGTG